MKKIRLPKKPELKMLKERKKRKIQAKRKKERAKNKKELAKKQSKKQKQGIIPRKDGRLDRASRYMSILYYMLGALFLLIMIGFYLGGT